MADSLEVWLAAGVEIAALRITAGCMESLTPCRDGLSSAAPAAVVVEAAAAAATTAAAAAVVVAVARALSGLKYVKKAQPVNVIVWGVMNGRVSVISNVLSFRIVYD